MGPTEFRLILMIVNTIFIYVAPVRDYVHHFTILGTGVSIGSFDYVGLFILLVLIVIHIHNFFTDARGYAKIDPLPAWHKDCPDR